MSYAGKRFGVVLGGAMALLGAVGCASPNVYSRPSPGMIAAAEDAVNAARAKGADRDGKAAPFLRSAERQMAAGKASMTEGDDRSATWLMARAAADGQLSHALIEKSRQESAASTTEAQLAETRSQAAKPAVPAEVAPE
jgi:hypothetical protein